MRSEICVGRQGGVMVCIEQDSHLAHEDLGEALLLPCPDAYECVALLFS